MPAIRYFNGSIPYIVNHNRDSLISGLEAYISGVTIVVPQWYGFTSYAGAAYLKEGRIVRIGVDAISSTEGGNDDDWILLPDGHFALGWWIPNTSRPSESGELYGLVDNFGWPMTTLRYNEQKELKLLDRNKSLSNSSKANKNDFTKSTFLMV